MMLSLLLENLAGRRAGVCLNAAPKLTQYENHSQTSFGFYCIALLRHGINDIQLFHENDVWFLRQF